jgi:hypothetical protein
MRPCSELPNDNPALHRGAIWRCEHTSGPATCVLPERVAPPREQADEATPGSPAPPASATPADAFESLSAVLEDVARGSGAADDVVAGLKALLGMRRLDSAQLPDASVEALVAGAQLERTPQGIQRTDAFTRTVLAWQAILRAEGEDFAACGPTALDEWAADFIARVLGSPSAAAGLRRELRRRGVAAFGLVAEAA